MGGGGSGASTQRKASVGSPRGEGGRKAHLGGGVEVGVGGAGGMGEGRDREQ
jgi:hypothetical protein